MKAAPIPENENARVEALRGYDVLDTLPEQAYDDISLVASHICKTPIAVVSLVDADRQWFKSKVGLDASETPRDIAFCAHAILEPDALFVVEDASADERFADNPLVAADPRIRFYAGAPLVTSKGHPLGTLCVIDRQPRRLSDEQAASLRALSRQVMAQLELRRTVKELEHSSRDLQRSHAALAQRTEQVERSRDQLAGLCQVLENQAEVIERDLNRAEAIQRSLLPHEAPPISGFCVQGLYRPGQSIGGDLYDVVGIADRYVALVVADAAGHGVSAAMVSVLFKHRLRVVDETSGAPLRPAAALASINASLLEDLSAPGMFVTAAFCLLDTQEGKLVVASAGHTPLLWLKANGELEEIEHTGPALGLTSLAVFEERELELQRGDQVLLYTDGLFDVGGEHPPTAATLAEALRAPAEDDRLLQNVLLRVSRGKERKDRDDVTMLLLRATPGESHFFETRGELGIESTPEQQQQPRILFAETPKETYFSLEGRVTWLLGQSLLDAGAAAIEAGRPIVLDLIDCEYLDSTLLGTLHELVVRSATAKTSLRIQHASLELRAAFDELCMHGVLELCSAGAVPAPPETRPLEQPETDLERQRQRLLRAHELLADLCEENRKQFGGIVDALKAEDRG